MKGQSTLIKVTCATCNSIFSKRIIDILRSKLDFCSFECHTKEKRLRREKNNKVNCTNCGIEFYKTLSQQKRTKNNFCSKSCAASYNNRNKAHGTRVSKLELFLQNNLLEKYSYDFHFNRKDTINSELDIYIPELKLAFELNGIFHYEPIYGEEKLNQIQNNDNRKFQACLEKQIALCIIDTSWIKYNKVQNFIKILNIIENIISNKL